jgi:mRNA-degrading endonuclease RelE of RelBE toxin-antitoxin system
MRIFTALQRFAETGAGNVKKLRGDTDGLRLKVGHFRVRFIEHADSIVVKRVGDRKDVYR